MKKIVCDRCGGKAYEEENVAFLEPHIANNGDGHRFTTDCSYDLCDKCLKQLKEWIEKQGGEKHERMDY